MSGTWSSRDPEQPARKGGEETRIDPGQAAPSAEAASRGERIGRYRIRRQIGQGGMGKVYLGHDEELDRPVAIKVISEEILANRLALERFRREARSVARLNHPGIVQIYEFNQEGQTPFFAMEFIEGRSLAELLAERGPLPVRQALELLLAAAEALDYARERGVVHRDVKPGNMLIDGKGRLKILDFGLATAIEGDKELTRTGTIIGSPYYMSPEQSRGEKADHRSDIYSLGVTLYHMLTGARPFEASSPMAVMLKQVQEPIPVPESLSALMEGRVIGLLGRMVEKDPARRFADYTGLLEEIRALLPYAPQEALPPLAATDNGAARARPQTPALTPMATDPIPVPDLDIDLGTAAFPGGETLQPRLPLPTGPSRRGGPPAWAWVVGAAALALCGGMLFFLLRDDGYSPDAYQTSAQTTPDQQAIVAVPTAAPEPTAAPPTPRPTAPPPPPTRSATAAGDALPRANGAEALRQSLRRQDFAGALKQYRALRQSAKPGDAQLPPAAENLEEALEGLLAFQQQLAQAINHRQPPYEYRHPDTGRVFRLHKADTRGVELEVAGSGHRARKGWEEINPALVLSWARELYGPNPTAETVAAMQLYTMAFPEAQPDGVPPHPRNLTQRVLRGFIEGRRPPGRHPTQLDQNRPRPPQRR